jgi:hypothetical protein
MLHSISPAESILFGEEVGLFGFGGVERMQDIAFTRGHSSLYRWNKNYQRPHIANTTYLTPNLKRKGFPKGLKIKLRVYLIKSGFKGGSMP